MTLKIILTGLMVFTPITGKEYDYGALLVDALQRTGNQIPHYPQLRIDCDAEGSRCQTVLDVRQQDLELVFLVNGKEEPSLTKFADKLESKHLVSLKDDLGLGAIDTKYTGKNLTKGQKAVTARFLMSQGKLESAAPPKDCRWGLAEPRKAPANANKSLAMLVTLEAKYPKPNAIARIKMKHHETGADDYIDIPSPGQGKTASVFLVNEPALDEGKAKQRTNKGSLVHFQRYVSLSADTSKYNKLVPALDTKTCAVDVLTQNNSKWTLGAGPIICTSARP